MKRHDILPRVIRHIWTVSPREQRELREDDCLVSCLWLQGAGLVKLAELLEEEFAITIAMGDVVDLALNGPTLGALLDLVEEAVVDA